MHLTQQPIVRAARAYISGLTAMPRHIARPVAAIKDFSGFTPGKVWFLVNSTLEDKKIPWSMWTQQMAGRLAEVYIPAGLGAIRLKTDGESEYVDINTLKSYTSSTSVLVMMTDFDAFAFYGSTQPAQAPRTGSVAPAATTHKPPKARGFFG